MYAENQRKDAVSRAVLSNTIKMHSMQDNRNFSTQQMKLKNSIQNADNPYRHMEISPSKSAVQLFAAFTNAETAKTEFGKSFIREEHFKPINDVCKSDKNTLSVREAGKPSLDRLGENANPKPHTILDKSISEQRLKDNGLFDPATEATPATDTRTVGGVSFKSIRGYVGYWEDTKQVVDGVMTNKTKLMGVIVTPGFISKLEEKQSQQSQQGQEEKMNINSVIIQKNEKQYIALEKFEEVKELIESDGTEKLSNYLYTGDYDIHEAYDKDGKLIPEGQPKADLLNKLNGLDNIITVDQFGNLQNVPKNAPFQHGDQSTFRQSVRNELKGADQVAVLNPVVAVEETKKLAWFCIGERWYTSDNPEEHKRVRDNIAKFLKDEKEFPIDKLAVPKEWEEDKSTIMGERKTKPYVKPYPGYKSGKTDEMFSPEYKFADDFIVDERIKTKIRTKLEGYLVDTIDKVVKAKAQNLIISNYKGMGGEISGKEHFKWTSGNETHFYNKKKKYDVIAEGKTIKSFIITNHDEDLPSDATRI